MTTETVNAEQFAETGATAPESEVEARAFFAGLQENRSRTYRFLSRLFRREVDAEMLRTLKQIDYPADTGTPEIDEGHYRIAKFLSNEWPDVLTLLAKDYVLCFIGYGMESHSAAYPYESVYLSEKHLMMQSARDEVLAVYRSQGVDKQADWKEGEDHVALEFEFMAILADRAAAAVQAGEDARYDELMAVSAGFMEDHILKWVPTMLDELDHRAKTGFYLGLAYVAKGFLKADSVFLKDVSAEQA